MAAEPALADLTWPAEIGVNAYLGVPVTTADTRPYLLCRLPRERRPDLGAADVNFLRGVAVGCRQPRRTLQPPYLAEARLRSRLAKSA